MSGMTEKGNVCKKGKKNGKYLLVTKKMSTFAPHFSECALFTHNLLINNHSKDNDESLRNSFHFDSRFV